MAGLKTYLGIFIAFISWVLMKAGFNVPVETLTEFVNMTWDDVGVLVGLAVAVYGRIMAFYTITKASKT
jgi:hypothetical protein